MKFERKLNKVADDINKYLKKIVLNEEKKIIPFKINEIWSFFWRQKI